MSILFQSFGLIILIIVVIINTSLSVIVFLNSKKNDTNKLFSLLSIVISIWLITMYLATTLKTGNSILVWSKLTIFFAAPMSFLFYLFSDTIPNKKQSINSKLLYFYSIATAIIMIIALSPYTFTHYELINSTYKAIPGFGMAPFGLLSTYFSGYAIITLYKRYYSEKGQTKQQLKFILIGILSMLGLIIFSIFIPVTFFDNYEFIPFSPIYALLFLATTAHAIQKHKLFDLKILATQAFVGLLSIILFSKIFIAYSLQLVIIDSVIFISSMIFGALLIKSVIQEVSQRQQLGKLNLELQNANTNLAELLQMKEEFIGLASHQLRTPLTTVIGLLDMQHSGDLDKLPPKDKKRYQKNMLDSAWRLNALINDLLDSTALDGGFTLNLELVNLIEMTNNICDEQRPTLDKRKLYCKVNPKSGDLNVMADKKYLHEALSNLVDNAIKYTAKGGLDIALSTEDNKAILVFRDSGMGIDMEEKEKLFQKFSRGHRAELMDTTGSGLGLYLVKKIVDAHNGTIEIESQGKNKGSTFTVKMPLKQEESHK